MCHLDLLIHLLYSQELDYQFILISGALQRKELKPTLLML